MQSQAWFAQTPHANSQNLSVTEISQIIPNKKQTNTQKQNTIIHKVHTLLDNFCMQVKKPQSHTTIYINVGTSSCFLKIVNNVEPFPSLLRVGDSCSAFHSFYPLNADRWLQNHDSVHNHMSTLENHLKS